MRRRRRLSQKSDRAAATPKPSDLRTPAARLARPVDSEVALKFERAMARKNGDAEAEKRANKALREYRKMMRGG